MGMEVGTDAAAATEVLGDLDSLRERVRSDLRDTSLPLVVIGAVLFAYATVGFEPIGVIPAILGLPAAFVIVWAISRQRAGVVGVGGGDVELIVAFAVFAVLPLAGSSLAGVAVNFDEVVVRSSDGFTMLDRSAAVSFTWPAMVVGGGVIALGCVRRRMPLVICGAATTVAGVVALMFWGSSVRGVARLPSVLIEGAAVAMILVGLVVGLRRDR